MMSTANRCEQVAVHIASRLEPHWLVSQPIGLGEDELYLNALICILSSQVPFEIAQLYAEKIFRRGRVGGIYKTLTYSTALSLLSGPVISNGRKRHYRFPKTRAAWIATNQRNIISDKFYFSKIIYSGDDPSVIRAWLAMNVMGLGLKQASMFIRTALMNDSFAILDRHILRYLNIIGLMPSVPKAVSENTYFELEDLFIRHARFRGFGVDLFDHATWITMRSLSEAA